MQWILATKHIISGLEVGNNLRETEHREAKMPWHNGFNGRAWPKVKRNEWHRFRLNGPNEKKISSEKER
jgi:hypothetical protein